jgi:hypothetical protein
MGMVDKGWPFYIPTIYVSWLFAWLYSILGISFPATAQQEYAAEHICAVPPQKIEFMTLFYRATVYVLTMLLLLRLAVLEVGGCFMPTSTISK